MTSESATLLDLYARVRTHLLVQSARAQRESPHIGCAYRGFGGLRCAIGCLVTDEAYDPLMEGSRINQLDPSGGRWSTGALYKGTSAAALAAALNRSGVPASDAIQDLLGSLQSVHDAHRPDSWESRLDELDPSSDP